MWISVKDLSFYVGISARTVQKAISECKVTARKKDKRSYEIELSSIPASWKEQLPEHLRKQSGTLAVISAESSVVVSQPKLELLGRGLTRKEKMKNEVSAYFKNLSPLISKSARLKMVSMYFGISTSTAERYIKEIEENGVVGKQISRIRLKGWDIEAESYLKSWYLEFLRQTNKDSKQAAWNAVNKKALEEGWNIGCRTSAYQILNSIPLIVKQYAVAGNRALDNHFYIARDWSSLKPSQIWIGDQHICDFWVVDYSNPGKPSYYRPCLYAWQDGATRCIAGLAVDKNYTSDTVLESLRMGIVRFGFFDCTYNDNGTSECSKAATQVIDDLILLSDGRSSMKDISDLYKREDGVYVVEDPDGTVVGATPDQKEWRRMHRRIYANVKNAKAKPIERLFGTIEEKMAQRGIPGHVVTPNAPAAQEEKEQAVLDSQKAKGLILTLEEFMAELVKGIDEYENSYHSTLRKSPRQALSEHIAGGWKAVRPSSTEELDFIFLSKARAKIRKGRVTINNIDYIGEDLKPVLQSGDFADVGLHLHEGEYVDIRYSKYDTDVCYAVLPSTAQKIRPLRPVKTISMLDDEAMRKGIAWKRGQMRAVRDIFKQLVSPSAVVLESKLSRQIEDARSVSGNIEALEMPVPVLHVADSTRKSTRSFNSHHDHYKWCMEQLAGGDKLDSKEMDFVRSYEGTEEYLMAIEYWNTFKKMEGIV